MPVKSDMKDKLTNSDVKDKSKRGRYSLKRLLDRSRFSPSLLFLSKSLASKSNDTPNEPQKFVHNDMVAINVNIENSASSSPRSYSPTFRRRLTASVPFDCPSDSPITTSTALRNPNYGSDHASPNSELIVEEEYEESLAQFADIILDGFKSQSNASSRKSPDTFSTWSDAALPVGQIVVPMHCGPIPFSGGSVDAAHQHHHHSHRHHHETSNTVVVVTPPPTNFGSYDKSLNSSKDINNIILNNINPSGIYNEPCDAKPTVLDDPITIYTTKSVLMKNTPIRGCNLMENNSCSNDSYSNHRDNNHPHCLCSENDDVDDSCQTTITVTNPLVHSTVTSESTQSREGSHSASALPYINSVANNSETNVIGIQLKNNASQSSVCFASSPRGNTVITHHPASPFSRVPRSTVGKNGINLKTSPIQSTQSSISKSNVCITATAMTTTATTTACIDNFSTNENIPVTNISATSDSSRVLVDFQSDVSDCSSQQQQHIHVNDNQQTSSTYNEANQLIHLTKTNSSVSHGSLTNMTNSSHGLSGRTRSSNVSTSYPTYEEAWDLKLARQLGIGVSRLPSIIPIASSSSSVQNYIPSLPTIPSHTSNTDHSSILILSSTSVDNQNNNHGIKNNSNLPSHQPLTDDMHSLESNMKSLTISASTSSTSTSSSFSSTSNDKRINPTNNSELITTSHVDDLDHVDVKRTYLNKLDQKSTDDTNHLLFPHDELITNHSSHMGNGNGENNGEYDYAYNGSWSMGVKLNLNLAINNSSGDLSVPLNTPKCSDPMTAAKTEVVRTVKSSLTNPPPPSYHPNYLHHHGLSFSSRLQEFNPTKLASIKSTISNDLKANLTTRTNLQSVLPNDLDSISTSSCDESWDARHGRLVSELMTGRFIDPVAVVPDTGKIKAMTTTTTTTTVNNNDFLNSVTCCNSSEANIPTVSGSCSTSSYSSSSSSSSVSINSHVIIASPAPPPSQCTNSIVQTFDQFTSSSGNSRHSMHSVSRNKLLSSQNNLPKGLPSHLEKLPLEEQPWFHPSLTRSEAEELIRNEPEGSFLVRPSETCPNDFSLTIK
ncbi:SH2 domain-containing adapter protein isoform 3 [Schistosoma japonicum]|nr:SH2 domain-containing adapter protein isoform 3 [Schistosoma japonicum]